MSNVPWTTEEELFWLCSYKCTLDGQRQYQKHHIDGDNQNDDPDNWTVLCINCHAEAQEDLQVHQSMARIFSEDRLRQARRFAIEGCLYFRYSLSQVVKEQQRIKETSGFLEYNPDRTTLIERTLKWLNRR